MGHISEIMGLSCDGHLLSFHHMEPRHVTQIVHLIESHLPMLPYSESGYIVCALRIFHQTVFLFMPEKYENILKL